jgi:hypothetical protein|tara:strand:- start:939 stop:1427 length:489 start_codon:yes stop_codon:yes gene_type:complete
MVLIVAPQQTVPDFEHEYHTVIVDSTDQSSPTNAYTTFLPTPLENVVQVELMAARFNTLTASTQLIHISVEELRTFFSQRAKANLETADDNHLNGIFGTVVTGGAATHTFKSEYPIVQQYLTPIRKLDRLNLKLYKEDGTLLATGVKSYFVFRFVCKKRNLM